MANKVILNARGERVTYISKKSIGLGNVDNTSDLNKPVSKAVTKLFVNGLTQDIEIAGIGTLSFTKGLLTGFVAE